MRRRIKNWFLCKFLNKHNWKTRTLRQKSIGTLFIYQCSRCGKMKKGLEPYNKDLWWFL